LQLYVPAAVLTVHADNPIDTTPVTTAVIVRRPAVRGKHWASMPKGGITILTDGGATIVTSVPFSLISPAMYSAGGFARVWCASALPAASSLSVASSSLRGSDDGDEDIPLLSPLLAHVHRVYGDRGVAEALHSDSAVVNTACLPVNSRLTAVGVLHNYPPPRDPASTSSATSTSSPAHSSFNGMVRGKVKQR
jgi:hypothetical protein